MTLPSVLNPITIASDTIGECSILQPTGLLDLPIEILEQILRDPELPNESLFNISLLSRRLHDISLPLFLARHGIDNPNGEVHLEFRQYSHPRIDALTGLHIALFISTVKRLSCSLSHPGIVISPTVTIFDRLRLFVQRLDIIDEFSLILKSAVYNRTHANAFSQSSQAGVEDGLNLFSLSFGRLLVGLVQKSCTSVTLGGAPGLSVTYRFWCRKPRNLNRGPWGALKELIDRGRGFSTRSSRSMFWEYGPPRSQYLDAVRNELSSLNLSSSKLTTLTLTTSPNLLTPPFSICVLSILQLSSITSLKICDISVAEEIWTSILPHLASAVPDLKELTISGCSTIPSGMMYQFLAGLNGLRTLTLGKFVQIEDEVLGVPLQPYPRRPIFTNLETLRVPHDWLFELLFVPDDMSQLNELTIYPRLGITGLHITYDIMFVLLRSIIRRLLELRWYPAINFTVPIGLQFCHLMMSFKASDGLPASDVTSSTGEALYGDDSLERIPAIDQPGVYPWVRSFPASTEILRVVDSLAIMIENAEVIDTSELSRWLALFPSLRRLVVRSEVEVSPVLVAQIREALVVSLKLPDHSSVKTEKTDTQPSLIIFEYAMPEGQRS